MARSTERDRVRALAVAGGLLGWSATKNSPIPGRHHPLVQAGLGTALAFAVGVRPGSRLRQGTAVGLAAASVVGAVTAAATAIPAVRKAMQQRDLPHPAWAWLVIDIPVGTVWAEEAAFRGALGMVAAQAFGPRRGRLLQACVFGLSHIPDARGAGEPVAGTVLVTGAAGWVFALLAERSGSLLAPALAHLAINEAGAVAALLVQRHRR